MLNSPKSPKKSIQNFTVRFFVLSYLENNHDLRISELSFFRGISILKGWI